MRRFALLLVALALPAAAQPILGAPGLVEGDPLALAAVDGVWVGAFDGAEVSGSLRIAIDAERGEAVVTLVAETGATRPPVVLRLAVHHATVEGGRLDGTLARFVDPVWGLELETRLRGTLGADGRLAGSFCAHGTAIDTLPLTGRWWATRAADRPADRPAL